MGGPDVDKPIAPPDNETLSRNMKSDYLAFHVEPGDKTDDKSLDDDNVYKRHPPERCEQESTTSSSQVTDSGLDSPSFESSHEKEDDVNCCDDKRLLMKTILSGQVLSVMLCSTGTAATALSTNYGIRTPSFYAFLMYTLLASTFGIYTITRKDFLKRMKPNWWKYLLVSICDVEANYLLTKAYAFTTLTSVQLCDSVTIPTVMIVSFIFLRIRYKALHYVGVFICIFGAVCLLFTDGGESSNGYDFYLSYNGSDTWYFPFFEEKYEIPLDLKISTPVNLASNEILGDCIALCAAVLYGISQVGQEYLVRKYSSQDFLGMIGIYGMFFSSIQVIALERNAVCDIIWTWQVGLLLASFAIAQYFYYSIMPVVIHLSSATVVNLSLLTSDLYTLTVGLFIFDYKFSYLYFLSFGAIFIGLIIYNIKPTPNAPPKKKTNKNINLSGIVKHGEITTFGKSEPLPLLHGNNMTTNQLYGSTSPTIGVSKKIGENSFKISGLLKDYIVKYTKL